MRAAAAFGLLAALSASACSSPRRDAGGPAAPADDDAIVQVIAEEGIAAVDAPVFADAAAAAAFMRPDEPVVGVSAGGRERAYSLWHLDRHEIVNDQAGEVPLVVAWCPIAWTARAFRREAAGRVLTFVVSGRLWRNALVMRDRETGSLWSQVNGAAIAGPLQGAELAAIPAGIAPWSEWSRLHPRTLVLQKPRLEGTLYPDYFADPERVGFYGQRRRDPRLPAKTRVIGIEAAGAALAVPLEILHARRIWNDRAGERPVLLFSPGADGPDLAYGRRLGTRELTFEAAPEGSTQARGAGRAAAGRGSGRDRETGSVWDLATGVAVSGPLEGARLEPLTAQTAYWFVWSAFHPGTALGGVPAPPNGLP